MSINLDDFFNEEGMLDAITEASAKKFWRPTKNKTVIRILPPLKPNGEKLFYFTHRVHWVNRVPYECINQTQVDKDGREHIAENCPLCNLARGLYKLGETDEESMELAKKISGKTKQVVRILVRDEGDNNNIYFYELPQKIHKMLMDNISSGDWGSVVHPVKGRDLIIIKNGTGVQTDYSSSQLSPKETPIHQDQAVMIAILNDAVKKPYNSLIGFNTAESLDSVVKEIARDASGETASTRPAPARQASKPEPKRTVSEDDLFVGFAEDNLEMDAPVDEDEGSGNDLLDSLLSELTD